MIIGISKTKPPKFESTREYYRRDSNNEENTNQNVCVQAVAHMLGRADQNVRYLHTLEDLVRAVRLTGFKVRSRKSKLNKNSSVGAARKVIQKLAKKENEKFPFIVLQPVAYIVRIEDHVLLLDNDGKTICDTAPRKADLRKIDSFYAVYRISDIDRVEMHLQLGAPTY